MDSFLTACYIVVASCICLVGWVSYEEDGLALRIIVPPLAGALYPIVLAAILMVLSGEVQEKIRNKKLIDLYYS